MMGFFAGQSPKTEGWTMTNEVDADLEDFDRRLWSPIENMCEPCAVRKNVALAAEKRRLIDEQNRARARMGPRGVTGRTSHTCVQCGGYRFEGWDT